MGSEPHSVWIQDRVHFSSANPGPFQVNSSTEKPGPKARSRGGNQYLASETSYLPRSSGNTVPIVVLSHSQETRLLEAHSKPEASQQTFCPSKEVSDGDPEVHPSNPPSRTLGLYHRSKGRIFTCPDPPRPPKVSNFSIQEQRLRFPRSSVWPCHGPSSVYQGYKGHSRLPPSKRTQCARLPGRLAPSRSLRRGNSSFGRLHDLSPRISRLDNQQREVLSHPVSTDCVPRSSSRLRLRQSFPDGGQTQLPFRSDSSPALPQICPSETVAPSPGPSRKLSGCGSRLPLVHETNPNLPSQVLLSVPRHSAEEGPSGPRDQASPYLVDRRLQPELGGSFQRPTPVNCYYDRCLSSGMGSSVAFLDGRGPVAQGQASSTHQQSGDGSGQTSHLPLEARPQESRSHSSLRQLYHSCLYQQTGRNQVDPSLPENLGASTSVQTPQRFTQSLSSSGQQERYGGRPLQGQPPRDGVVSLADMGQLPLRHVWSPVSRPVCLPGQLQTSGLLHQILPPTRVGHGRSVSVLGRSLRIRLSSLVPCSTGPPEGQGIPCRDSSNSPVVAQTSLVPDTPATSSGPPVQTSQQGQPVNPAERSDLASTFRPPSSDSLETFIQRLQSQGLSQEAARIAADARRPSTRSTYDSRLQRFRQWAEERDINPMEASLETVSDFFLTLFNEGKQVSTIRNYRSAIASIHSGFSDGSTLGSNEAISQLLKGMFNRRPPRKPLIPAWSINDVLTSLASSPYEPIQNATLEHLTHKTLFLIAAASARRRSELHALSVNRNLLRFSNRGVFLLPDPQFLTKNESISFAPAEVFLPDIASSSSIYEDRKVCPVRALKWYLEKTKPIRTSDALFILPKSPYNRASKDTLSRWLVNLITPHVTDGQGAHAHQLRAQSSSTAWFRGVHLDDIIKAAAWKTPSTFVSCYLTNVALKDGHFGRAALGVGDAQRQAPPSSRC